jgi:uncharacterized protein YlxW (UPF0749 family)
LALAGWSAVSAVGYVALVEHRRAERLAQLAGMTKMHGPGLEIILTDGAGSPAQDRQPVVTDGDVIFLNMLLWYGGTRAVSINEQRITALSTITSSGPALLINGARIVGPFRITALGESGTLRGVLTQAGFLDQMRKAGVRVEIAARPNLQIPAWQPAAGAEH